MTAMAGLAIKAGAALVALGLSAGAPVHALHPQDTVANTVHAVAQQSVARSLPGEAWPQAHYTIYNDSNATITITSTHTYQMTLDVTPGTIIGPDQSLTINYSAALHDMGPFNDLLDADDGADICAAYSTPGQPTVDFDIHMHTIRGTALEIDNPLGLGPDSQVAVAAYDSVNNLLDNTSATVGQG